ncbi:MAG: nitrilase family protein [Flavobacteriales bacterium]|nr:nitrilase family protein [Flavobacteriales bacterium]MDW8432686.1 nitrilase-related carbon-nitrogen hydrolase [Flavobacteriales bacterium]
MQPLSFCLVQTNPAWERPDLNLWIPEPSDQDIPQDSIVVLPEMFNTGYTMNTDLAEPPGGPACQWLLKEAARRSVVMVGSVMTREGSQYFNRLYWAEPTGQLSWYDKKHLFTLAGEDKVFSPGTTQCLVVWKDWKIALFTCYDLRFPVWCRRRPDFDYDVALFVASWPERRSYAWRALLKARAIENQSYVVAVNRCGYDGAGVLHAGDSQVVDFSGHVLAAIPPFHPGCGMATIFMEKLIQFRKALPFQQDSDAFLLL